MPLMKARQSHGWKQGRVDEGDEYEATEQEATLLEALGWSQRKALNGTVPRRRGRYQTRDVTAN